MGFFTPKPSFPDFGVFDPCAGWTDSQLFAAYHLHPLVDAPEQFKSRYV